MMDGQGGSSSRKSLLPAKSFSFEADLLRILAEIRFINAEVNKLHNRHSYSFSFILYTNLEAPEF